VEQRLQPTESVAIPTGGFGAHGQGGFGPSTSQNPTGNQDSGSPLQRMYEGGYGDDEDDLWEEIATDPLVTTVAPFENLTVQEGNDKPSYTTQPQAPNQQGLVPMWYYQGQGEKLSYGGPNSMDIVEFRLKFNWKVEGVNWTPSQKYSFFLGC